MQNKKIEFLYEYVVPFEDFKKLDENSQSLIAISCYAVTEINVFAKLYIFGALELLGDDPLEVMNMIQRLTILRSWAAKLFEFHDCIKTLRASGTDAEAISAIKSKALCDFDQLTDGVGRSLAKIIRNEATSHYSLKAAKKNLSHIAGKAKLSMLAHEMTGNSMYPLGEEVMFAGRLNRYGQSRTEGKETLVDDWMNHNLKVTEWVRVTHESVVKNLLLARFPERRFRQRMHYIRDDSAAEIGSLFVPIFARKRDL